MGLDWTHWHALETASVAACPGLYRLRVAGADTLTYVGETTDLRTRLRSHAARLRHLQHLECGVVPLELSAGKAQRLEWENDLLAHHFVVTGQAPAAQFGEHTAPATNRSMGHTPAAAAGDATRVPAEQRAAATPLATPDADGS